MHTQTAAGIDLGKDTIHVCITQPDQPAHTWNIQQIQYKDDDWPAKLIAIIPPGAPVVAEPTGGNLIAPVAAVLQTHAPLYLVNHQTTGHIRQEHIGRTKNDANDARALALAAAWINTPAEPRSARRYNHAHADNIAALRLYIDNHRRLSKTKTAISNRLESIAFSIWPAIAHHRETWIRAILDYDAITPQQLLNLEPDNWPHQTTTTLNRLRAKLDYAPEPHPARVEAARQLAQERADVTARLEQNLNQIKKIISAPPLEKITECWSSVPGSGPIAIASLHAATHGNIDAYTLSQFRAAIGTNPQGKSSGKSSHAKQSRSGYKPAAAQIHLWTMSLIRTGDNRIADYFNRTTSTHALAAARNKLAAILWTIATRREQYHE